MQRNSSNFAKSFETDSNSHILGKVHRESIRQQFYVAVTNDSTLAPGAIGTGHYAMYNPLPADDVFAIDFLGQLTQHQFLAGQDGYSGKFYELIEQYQYMRVCGHRITYKNQESDGSAAIANRTSGVPLLQLTLPTIAFAVIPVLNTAPTIGSGAFTLPSDIYEYPNCLWVQPNQTNLANGLSKDYSWGNLPISSLFEGINNQSIPNIWNLTDSYISCNLYVGTGSVAPTVYNASSVSVPSTIGEILIGSITVETFFEFAVPIKNQIIP